MFDDTLTLVSWRARPRSFVALMGLYESNYLLSHPTEPLEYPDMRIRIYHDAHLVEAQAWAASHPHPLLKTLRSRAERELDQRWARNVMLNKWLEYCVERGHRFAAGARVVSPS